MATKIIAIVAQKGGVGKSTITVQIATILATFGKKILVVNSDTYQNSAGESLSQRDDSNISCITIPTKNLRRELRKEDLIGQFDLIIIDGEGSMHEHSRAALEICDYFVVPVKPSQFDLNSYVKYMASVIEPVSDYKDLSGGVVLNEFEKDAASKETLAALKEFNVPVFKNHINRSKTTRKASGLGLSVAEHSPQNACVVNVFSFVEELCEAAKIKARNFNINELKRLSIRRKNQLKENSHAGRKNHQKKNNNPSTNTKTSSIFGRE